MGILLAEENTSQYAKKTSVIMKKKHIKSKRWAEKNPVDSLRKLCFLIEDKSKKKGFKKNNFSLEKAIVYKWIFEASGSARQTVLELYKVFSNYIFWSCLLAQKRHKTRKSWFVPILFLL